MLEQLESNYDCSRAGEDLHNLKQELERMRLNNGDGETTMQLEQTDKMNRIENQIHFIQIKCGIHSPQ